MNRSTTNSSSETYRFTNERNNPSLAQKKLGLTIPGVAFETRTRELQTATSRSTFDPRVVVDTHVETAGRLCQGGRHEQSCRKDWSSDFLPALNQTDRACNIDQPDVSMEGRCYEQLIRP